MHVVRRPTRAATVTTAAPFSGNFADLFPGAYQIAQTDKGLTYGGTMLATGTTPPVITLTGTLTGNPVPIQVVVGVTGPLGTWTFQVSYDGGSTVAQVGTSSASPVPLVGAGTGLSLNFAAGSASADNVWKATCAALGDQSGNGKNYAQATASKQPVIGVGLNGKVSLIGDGVSQNLVSLCNLPAPGTTPHYLFAVLRQITWISNAVLIGHTTGALEIFQQVGHVSPKLNAYHGAISADNGGAALGTWVDVETTFSNSASDPFKVGATTVNSQMGNIASNGLEIFSLNSTRFANAELLLLVVTPVLPNWATVRAAVNSAAGYGIGAVLL